VTELPGQALFEECLHEPFRLRLDDGEAVQLVLAEVTRNGAGSFSAVFRGAPDFQVPQRIWRLEHDRLGELDLFLVPIGPDEHGSRFEAVFN
jgi:hypothetical protein